MKKTTLMQSYSLPVATAEQIWLDDFASELNEGLSKGLSAAQQQLLHQALITLVQHASDHSRAKTLHIIVEWMPNNIEMIFQDNGVGLFQQVALQNGSASPVADRLAAQMQMPEHCAVAALLERFDYAQIEANGLHYPLDQAPDIETDEELYEQGTTVILGLTLNHDHP